MDASASPDRLTATVDLEVGGSRLRAEITVPSGPVGPRALLPVFRSVADTLVQIGTEESVARGERVSCRAGCGACCSQLVPVTPVEAHQLREVVERLPEPRRSEVRARFAAAVDRLDRTGLSERLLEVDVLAPEERSRLGVDYFGQGIPCPFLEDGSCSIYEERPIACREYLVTSPAVHCASPTAETVRMVPLPARASVALSRATRSGGRWVPLALALRWAEAHAEEPDARPAPQLVAEFFEVLAGGGAAGASHGGTR